GGCLPALTSRRAHHCSPSNILQVPSNFLVALPSPFMTHSQPGVISLVTYRGSLSQSRTKSVGILRIVRQYPRAPSPIARQISPRSTPRPSVGHRRGGPAPGQQVPAPRP